MQHSFGLRRSSVFCLLSSTSRCEPSPPRQGTLDALLGSLLDSLEEGEALHGVLAHGVLVDVDTNPAIAPRKDATMCGGNGT
jgi:hypothetical protein